MQLLTHLLPANISGDLTLAWCKIYDDYSIDILNADEWEKYRAFESDNRRREYLASRWLIRQMLQEMDLNPDTFLLKKDEKGKPFGEYDGINYHISIAHTKERVVCGISLNLPIGIDIEPESRSAPPAVRRRILTARELSMLKDEQTIRLWTLKEASVKLQGEGLRTNLRECNIISADERLFMVNINGQHEINICSFNYRMNWLAIAWNH
ncbi:MAG TPA: 4'-phosphopantetheinyl transferase superfamily protein [Balneolaceae bacterium]|nr:4'-phosphopantetheinyl transferase superfamily protein [Balneolaceae bacterium]